MAETNKNQLITERLEEVNALIAPYRLAWVDPKAECKLVEKNPRYMSKEMIERLSENIRIDGFLSQLPFGIKQENGKYMIVSGNHRIKAAIRAKQERVLILYGLEVDFDKNRQLAVQLSHNAIVGEDDNDILKELYYEIDDLFNKEYTGIVDDLLRDYEPVKLSEWSEMDIPLYELTFSFCQTDHEYVQQILDRLELMRGSNEPAIVLGDMDRFVEVMTQIKKRKHVRDRSIAFLRMCQICEDHLRTTTL